MANNFGTVEFNGMELGLTQEAYVDNYGTDGEVRYYANVVDADNNEYKVTWKTSGEFDKSSELYSLVEELKNLTSQKSFDDGEINRMSELEEEIETMESEGISSNYCEDGANACDWENPINIYIV